MKRINTEKTMRDKLGVWNLPIFSLEEQAVHKNKLWKLIKGFKFSDDLSYSSNYVYEIFLSGEKFILEAVTDVALHSDVCNNI